MTTWSTPADLELRSWEPVPIVWSLSGEFAHAIDHPRPREGVSLEWRVRRDRDNAIVLTGYLGPWNHQAVFPFREPLRRADGYRAEVRVLEKAAQPSPDVDTVDGVPMQAATELTIDELKRYQRQLQRERAREADAAMGHIPLRKVGERPTPRVVKPFPARGLRQDWSIGALLP